MSVFCYKKVSAGTRLSQQFIDARNALGKTEAELSLVTHIPNKYLAALERGAYEDLPPAKAYRTAYVKEYAAALCLDPVTALRQFVREGGLSNLKVVHPHTGVRLFPFASLSILVRNLVLGLASVLFLSYLGWQVRGVLEPPKLVVFAPFEGDTSSDRSIMVQGETEPETHVSINGTEVMANGKGAFETKLDATDGLNTITVSATKKHGKTTTITRHVVVRQKLTTEAGSIQ